MENSNHNLTELTFDETIALAKLYSKNTPRKSVLLGYTLIILWLSLTSLTCYFLIKFSLFYNIKLNYFSFLLIFFVSICPFFQLLEAGNKLLKKNGLEVLQNRHYGLYLRRITDEYWGDILKWGFIRTPETNLSSLLKKTAPLIALGKESEEMAFGGYRLFITDAKWQLIVYNIIRFSHYIVLRWSNTENLTWEIITIRKVYNPLRFILYFEEIDLTDLKRLNDLNLFEEIVIDFTTQFIAFDKNWKPYIPYFKKIKKNEIYFQLMEFVKTKFLKELV
ncbi:hypothetical protein SAMN06265337_4224 [Hymenobacter gelipurpurascens]|uniref:DUF3137 domain-containing protein n=1 Tax=Hymenobacter gelipurpurascens TaxID=89968 RepID=A0A212UH97_9BACT|nr:hypothetical protein [Hymenobacter gelipurpurascens]SNC77627.1 hypothetical protein SAMN06265337_4224 [Hymenobacter gelipurpurascens]